MITLAAEAIARVSYAAASPEEPLHDEVWRAVWWEVWTEGIRDLYRDMARAAAAVLRGR